MESNFRSGTVRDVRDLCDLYGVAEESQRRHLMQLARDSRQRGWWQSDDPPQYSSYIDFENDAISIKMFHSAVIPGLAQTVEYAKSLHQNSPQSLSEERINQLIAVRLTRQRILARIDPPNLWMILDEAALRRSVGGPESMQEQLGRILEISTMPNVSLQIIPFRVGAHVAMDSSFTILEYNDPVPALVYAEGLIGSIYLEETAEVEKYQRTFEILSSSALSENESAHFITQMIKTGSTHQ